MTVPQARPTSTLTASGTRSRAWWAAAALLFAGSFGTNVPTPLLIIYRDRLDLTPSTVTAIFGVYALGLAPSLLVGGPASDRFGRTRLLLPAVVLAGLASLLFVPGADSVPMLFVARFVQGLASGAVFSIGSAWLQDLSGAGRGAAAARRASLALNGGFCLGPLTSGLIGEYGAHPLVVPYVVHVVLVVVLVAFARTVARGGTWTAGRSGSPGGTVRPQTGLHGRPRNFFRQVVIPTAVCVYAFPSVAIAVLPLLLDQGGHVVAFTGVLSAVTLGAGALVQPIAHRLGDRRGSVGAACGAVGYALGVVTALSPSALPVFVAGAFFGVGGGLCLNAGLVAVQHLSTPASRGAVNGLFYAWAYVGFAVPFLATSFVSTDGLKWPLLVLTCLAAATSVWVGVRRRALPVE